MENKEITYEKVIGCIRNLAPEFENPEELTQSITARIERIAKNKKKRIFMRITGLSCGAVACLLLCLPMYEIIRPSAYRYAETKAEIQLSVGQISTDIPEIQQTGTKYRSTETVEIIKKLKQRNKKKRIYSIYLRKSVNK
jgi:hypothetical protein